MPKLKYDDLVTLARDHALAQGRNGMTAQAGLLTYLPNTPEQRDEFTPHSWVLNAIKHAYDQGIQDEKNDFYTPFDLNYGAREIDGNVYLFRTADGKIVGSVNSRGGLFSAFVMVLGEPDRHVGTFITRQQALAKIHSWYNNEPK